MEDSGRVSKVTKELSQEIFFPDTDPEISYRPVPHAESGDRPVWRVTFTAEHDSDICLGFDINDEVLIGREIANPRVINLVQDQDADALGVSRRHALLRPTGSKLYLVDLASTNGTKLNGQRIGANTPYQLSHSDQITLGRLEVILEMVKTPSKQIPADQAKPGNDDSIIMTANAIMTQLTVGDVLRQAIEQTWFYTHADEISIWLVDETTGELYLEAERGIHDASIRGLRLSVEDSVAGEVLRTGKPVRLSHSRSGSRIQVKTGYLVEAVMYVPIKLSGIAFGVLFAAHQQTGTMFNELEEKWLTTIAEFTAIGVQNARRYQANYAVRIHEEKILTALKYAMRLTLKQQINMIIGAAGLLDAGSDQETQSQLALQIIDSANVLNNHLEMIVEAFVIGEDHHIHMVPCELMEIVEDILYDLRPIADRKGIRLHSEAFGDPYRILGNQNYLRRILFHLVDNAIRYSPVNELVRVSISFGTRETIIRVQDNGPGIPEEDIPYLFEKYYRGQNSEGLGLGLEVVRSIVEAHRGTISVRNRTDGGAEFIITIPQMMRV
jgi:signal transduction histidine kinase